MKTKEEKLDLVHRLLVKLDLTREDVVDYWIKRGNINKYCISQIIIGMFCYEDNSFSFDKIKGKKVKGIVEAVKEDNNVIYLDLTASELFNIEEKSLNWFDAKLYIEQFVYPCNENEKIVWYDFSRLVSIARNYDTILNSFTLLNKSPREGEYWSSDSVINHDDFAWFYGFNGKGSRGPGLKDRIKYIRPVLEVKLFV